MKYPHLSNHDIIKLLDTSRLMHHCNFPPEFNAISHPTGHDLLEVIKERLELGAGAIMNEVTSNTRIDLDYLFTHNHDIRQYIEISMDNALDFRNGRFARPTEEILEDIMASIHNNNLIARAADEVFVLYIGYEVARKKTIPEEKLYWNGHEDFLIAKVK